jgi:hypothetical protein
MLLDTARQSGSLQCDAIVQSYCVVSLTCKRRHVGCYGHTFNLTLQRGFCCIIAAGSAGKDSKCGNALQCRISAVYRLARFFRPAAPFMHVSGALGSVFVIDWLVALLASFFRHACVCLCVGCPAWEFGEGRAIAHFQEGEMVLPRLPVFVSCSPYHRRRDHQASPVERSSP